VTDLGFRSLIWIVCYSSLFLTDDEGSLPRAETERALRNLADEDDDAVPGAVPTSARESSLPAVKSSSSLPNRNVDYDDWSS